MTSFRSDKIGAPQYLLKMEIHPMADIRHHGLSSSAARKGPNLFRNGEVSWGNS